jgi:hypothetical protein
MNIFLSRFYSDVKDPQWPDVNNVETYTDYLMLPDHIKHECENLHRFEERFCEIEDADYWRNLTIPVYRYNNLAYVPLAKCASSYYISFFKNNGWEETTLGKIGNNVHLFGLMMDPSVRWIKGLTQFLSNMFGLDDISDQMLEKIMQEIVTPDVHTISYRTYLGNYLEKIHWIPMDLPDQQIKTHIINFCKGHGHDINLPINNDRIHTSSNKKLALFNKIKSLHTKNFNANNSLGTAFLVQLLLADDIKFYRKLVKSFITSNKIN